MSEKRRYIWLDIIKIIACFFVIMNHSHNILFQTAGYNNGTVIFDAITFSICKVAVPLFVMTTGYLSLKKEISFKKTLLRIARILLPLIVASYYYYIMNSTEGSIAGFIKSFIANPQETYLWYLYMLLGLYFVIPFITKIVLNSSRRELGLFVGLFLIAPSAINWIAGLLHYSINTNWFSSFFHISVCYLIAGVYFSKIPLKRSFLAVAIALLVASEAPVAISIIKSYKASGQMVYSYDSWSSLPVIIASISIFYILRYFFEEIKPQKRLSKFIQEVSATTFGIYLVHVLAINVLYDFSFIQSMFKLNAFFGLIVFQIIIFAACSLFIFILRKIPIVKWFL